MKCEMITGLVLTVCLIGFIAPSSLWAETVKDTNAAAASSVTAKLPDHKVRIVIVGDTTAKDKKGWGPGFKSILNDNAEYYNMAVGGRSSKKFIDENRWARALALKGNYYLIQFGHNDESAKDDSHTDPNTTYRQLITRYVDEARANGAKPILITSLVRRQWDANDSNKIKSVLTPYAEVVKAIAAEKKVPLVDLHARSKELYEQLGQNKSNELAALKDDGSFDNTHLNDKGSAFFGKVIAEELIKIEPDLKPCFRSEQPSDANSTPKVTGS